MKKTLTINLNGIVFNIDEDAYQVLNEYLTDLGKHFSADEKEEILKDIEARIAELFTEKLGFRNVVEIQDVQEVMDTLGHPDQFENDNTQDERKEHFSQTSEPSKEEKRRHRKFYLDGDNKVIGGVAGGVAAYFDLDPLLIRILFVCALLISFGWAFLIYILIWALKPEAKTVSQKLEMQGIDPNIDNIRDFSSKEECVKKDRRSGALGTIVKIIFVVFLGIVGLSLCAAALGVLIALFAIVFNMIPGISSGTNEIILLISAILLLLCPAIAIIVFCVRMISDRPSRCKWLLWTLLILWIASIVGFTGSSIKSIKNKEFNHWKEHIVTKIKTDDDIDLFDEDEVNILMKERSIEPFEGIIVSDAIDLKLAQDDLYAVNVKCAEKYQPRIITKVKDKVLYIYDEGKNRRGKVTVYVTVPDLRKVELHNASSLECTSSFIFKNLTAEISDASDLELTGHADSLWLTVNDASDADLENIKLGYADISAFDASDVELGIAKTLRLRSHDASSITYQGNPDIQEIVKKDLSSIRLDY